MITICGACKAEHELSLEDMAEFPASGFPLLPCGHPDDPRTSAVRTTVGACNRCGRPVRWFAGEPAPQCLNSRDAKRERFYTPKRQALQRRGVPEHRLWRAARLWMYWRREWIDTFCLGKVVEL